MTQQPYTTQIDTAPKLGLVVLQADATIEIEMRHLLPASTPLYVSRVPSGEAVTPDSLAAMADHITTAADLFPRGMSFAALAYACTSGTAAIGIDRVDNLLRAGATTEHISTPITALIAACGALGVTRLGFISPYIQSVSDPVRDILSKYHITTPSFTTFDEAVEARVTQIDTASIISAGTQIATQAPIDALFLSCTNLRTLAAIPALEDALGIPVISSNLALAWHMARLSQTPLISPSRFLV